MSGLSAPAASTDGSCGPGSRPGSGIDARCWCWQPPSPWSKRSKPWNQGGHRVARQTEDERVAAHTEPDGLAGLHPHAVEHTLDAQRLERRRDQVVVADADPAREQAEIGVEHVKPYDKHV